MLVREVHHRVKNNLQLMSSLLNLEASRAGNPEVTRIVRMMQNRLRAVSLVHDQLHRSSALRSVDVRTYVSAVLDGLSLSHDLAGRGIAIRLRAASGPVGMNDALRIGLVLNELVWNAVVHGFPEGRQGRISVAVTRPKDGHIVVRVANNGVPLPPQFSPSVDRLGLAIVGNIARNCGGRFEWSCKGGASFLVELKSS
jgi:two-component system, sensor histidine kinase PdtaS